MSNLRFYIFGVPDGFDILSGTPEDIQYYQLFYDTSKKGREMRINRKPNGETVYSYLIYNLVSSKGREGAFLGMSLTFTGNEYCNNPAKLKELFYGVYEEVILKADDKDKIVMPLDGGNAVGRFCLSKFNDRKDFCDKVGRIIVNNVVGELANSITKIDGSFDNSKEGRVVTLPMNADAVSIVNALHVYMWVALSSECKPTQTDPHKKPIYVELLDRHYISELANKEVTYKDFVIDGHEGKVSVDDVNRKISEVSSSLDTIEKYIGHQPELRKISEEYSDIYRRLDGLRKKMMNESNDSGSGEKPLPDQQKSLLTKITQWMQDNSKKVAGVIVVIFAIVLVVAFWPKDEESGGGGNNPIVAGGKGKELTDTVEISKFDKTEFSNLLIANEFKGAWEMAQREEQPNTKKKYETDVTLAFDQMVNDELTNRKSNEKQLIELKDIIRSYIVKVDYNNQNDEAIANWNKWLNTRYVDYNNQIDEAIANLNKTPKEGSPRKAKVEIWVADDNYNKQSLVDAGKNNTIQCNQNSQFVILNADGYEYANNLEATKKDRNTIRIRATNTGTGSIKLKDGTTFTFNIKRS